MSLVHGVRTKVPKSSFRNGSRRCVSLALVPAVVVFFENESSIPHSMLKRLFFLMNISRISFQKPLIRLLFPKRSLGSFGNSYAKPPFLSPFYDFYQEE